MVGRLCVVEPLDVDRHGPELFAANSSEANWKFLVSGPYESEADYLAYLAKSFTDDPMAHAILVDGKAVGLATFMRINPTAGSIEVGNINLSPLLQRTPASTEAMHLMMARAFELGYRRYEWKCDAANGPSRTAALRLGFTFEGIHRQALIVKGLNRDTAWFSILDKEWPAVREAHQRWLSPENFSAGGRQRESLSKMTAKLHTGS
ncbi:UNVERIFIED_CONTAM: hypothetical protein GTU68_002572 [Idotea baltica]|nr:hypothetical protein [Idotea baltica]